MTGAFTCLVNGRDLDVDDGGLSTSALLSVGAAALARAVTARDRCPCTICDVAADVAEKLSVHFQQLSEQAFLAIGITDGDLAAPSGTAH